MASNIDFVQYIADQCAGADEITYKRCLVTMAFIAKARFLG